MLKIIKYVLSFLFVFLCVGLNQVFAKNITLDDVVEQMKRNELYEYFNSFEELGMSVEIKTLPNLLSIVYNAGEKGTITSNFEFKDDIISYTFSGNKDNLNDEVMTQSSTDNIWLNLVLIAVAELKGYTEEDLMIKNADGKEVLKDTIINGKLAENGVELSLFDIDYTYADGSTLDGQLYENFKIDINNFKLDKTGNVEAKEPSTSEDKKDLINPSVVDDKIDSSVVEEVPENPNTGIFLPIISLSILGVICFICFYSSNKGKKFKKI